MKLIETPGNCKHLPLGKDVSLSLKQSLHVISVPREMGHLSCFLNYFFPNFFSYFFPSLSAGKSSPSAR